MPILNSLRLLTNKVLAPAGFAILRVNKTKPWGNPIVTTQVGRFTIQVPRVNQVSTEYQERPGYMMELAELTALIKKKYPHLSAIDIGANVGNMVCTIKMGADIPVLCFEGDEISYKLLEQNIRQFQFVTAHKQFLGEKTEKITAKFEKAGWNTTIIPTQSPTAQPIQISSLDDFLTNRPIEPGCKLMKIDAEGFDCRIIRGAAKFLQQSRPVLTFEYNRDNMEAIGEKGFGTLSMLYDLGYSEIIFHDCNGRFFTAATLPANVLIEDLLDYADGKNGSIYYFDLTAFHVEDTDIALEFIKKERAHRNNAHTHT
jgi:FkbM family methyltransferase